MNKPTHVIGGITAGIAVNNYIVPVITETASFEGIVGIVTVMGGAVFGSVLPDIDKRDSFIGRRVWPFSLLIELTIGHRGATHAPLFTLGFSTLLFYGVMQLPGFSQVAMLFFVLGLISGISSHLLLDSLTKQGIPLYYPFSKKHVSLLPFKTGGIGEIIVSLGCMLLILLMFQESAFYNMVLDR